MEDVKSLHCTPVTHNILRYLDIKRMLNQILEQYDFLAILFDSNH